MRRLLQVMILLTAVFALPVAKAQEHTTLKVHQPGSFSTNWTHAIATSTGLFWYNAATGAAVLGQLDGAGNHTTIKAYPPESFTKGWTHLVDTPSGLLWYNARTGAGVVGRIQ